MSGFFSRRRGAPAAGPRALPDLPTGAAGTISRIEAADPSRLVKLSNLGLMPGARVRLVQKVPAVVVEVGETTVALDAAVARHILVEP